MNMDTVNQCLNPFVQVFYSNMSKKMVTFRCDERVLIPLFRSFILMQNAYKILRKVKKVLIPLFRSFILMGVKNEF